MSGKRFNAKSIVFWTILLVAALALSGCRLLGGSGIGGVRTGYVAGEILDEDGNKITKSVSVALYRDTDADPVASQTTDDGTYQLAQVRTGIYTLKATAEGYHPWQRQIRLGAGLNEINIELSEVEIPDQLFGQAFAPEASLELAFGPAAAPSLWTQLAALISPVAHAQTIDGQVPFADAQVTVWDWFTGEEYEDFATTTDEDGKFVLQGADFPWDRTLIIRVQKDDLRLSLILPNAQPTETEDDLVKVDAVSTLVAEILGAVQGEPIDEGLLAEVRDEVLDLINEVSWDELDLRFGKGWLTEDFGSVNAHPKLVDIRLSHSLEREGVARARAIVNALRNIQPLLMAYAGPVIDDAEKAIGEKVGPLLAGASHRMAIIGALVEKADLHPLEEKTVEIYDGEDEDDSQYKLTVDILDVVEESEVDGVVEYHVTAAFQIEDLVNNHVFGDGEMVFDIADDEPVEFMVLTYNAHEEVNGEPLVATITAEITFEWFDKELRVGDIRDLKGITIEPVDSEIIDTALLTANGTLTAEFDAAEWYDWQGRLVHAAKVLTFDGSLEVPEVGSIVGTIEYSLDSSDGTYQATAENVTITVERLGQELVLAGTFSVEGQLDSEASPDPGYGYAESSFNGTFNVVGYRELELEFTSERTGDTKLKLDIESMQWYNIVLSGTADVAVTPGDELGTWTGGTVTFDLTDDKGYKLDFTVTADGSPNPDVEGTITTNDGDVVAKIELDSSRGPLVYYYVDDQTIQVESLY